MSMIYLSSKKWCSYFLLMAKCCGLSAGMFIEKLNTARWMGVWVTLIRERGIHERNSFKTSTDLLFFAYDFYAYFCVAIDERIR